MRPVIRKSAIRLLTAALLAVLAGCQPPGVVKSAGGAVVDGAKTVACVTAPLNPATSVAVEVVSLCEDDKPAPTATPSPQPSATPTPAPTLSPTPTPSPS